MPPRTMRERGFTLIEVLVALVIASILTVILLDGAATARVRAQVADNRQKAVFIVRSLLNERLITAYGEGPSNGTINGLHWVVRETVILIDPRGLYGLARIEAEVQNERSQPLFRAETRKLKSMPPA